MRVSKIMVKVPPISLSDIENQPAMINFPGNINFLPVVDDQHRFIGTIKPDAFPYRIDPGTPTVFSDEEVCSLPNGIAEAVVTDADGHVLGILTSPQLINGLRESQEKFREQFFTIINSAHNGILVVDAQGVIQVANRVVEELVGLPRVEIFGRPVTEVIPNSLMPQVLESGRSLLGGKVAIGALTVLANYSPILTDGKITGAVCVFQDISLLETTMSELSSVKSLIYEFEAIFNCSYDGIFMTDSQGVVVRCNESYERIAGIKASEVVGKSMTQLVDEKYYDESVAMMVIGQKKRVTINQKTKSGRDNLVTGNPIFDKEGNLFRVVTNVRDITELVSLQDQLSKNKEQTLKYQAELSHLRSQQLEENDIVFRSRSMFQAISIALKVADVDSSVLITGDSGTGKELIAKLIHKKGKGVDKPFIKINCGALPEQLLESELFGYEGGAFTGAKREGKLGLFELAQNGTLFLDENGDMPLALQVTLLRAIQEKEIMRVGGTKTIKVNARIITATHRDIPEMMEEGKFRKDLFYRLMVVPIHLAPLRERKEDIPLLIRHFIDQYNRHFNFCKTISPQVVDKLMEYSWPGNVRELENLIERMMVMSPTDNLTLELLPENIRKKNWAPQKGETLKATIEKTESYLLAETYREYPSWAKVADMLGIDQATAYRKAKRYGLLKSTCSNAK